VVVGSAFVVVIGSTAIVVVLEDALSLSSKLSKRYLILFSDSSVFIIMCLAVIESVIASTASIGMSSNTILD